jgi:hypothetical protein
VDTFAARYTGLIRVDTTGDYTFQITSDDGSRLWIDGAPVIGHDGRHAFTSRSVTMRLAAGFHALRVDYFEDAGSAGLNLAWDGPGFDMQTVPASHLGRPAGAFATNNRTDGLIAIEGENAHHRIARNGHFWANTGTPGGFSGGAALQVVPDLGGNVPSGGPENQAQLNYTVRIGPAGVYYIWLRGLASNGASDEVTVGINGVRASTLVVPATGQYTWSRTTTTGGLARLVVNRAGRHTLNLWMRDDGLVVDKIVVTRAQAFRPVGFGPPENRQV